MAMINPVFAKDTTLIDMAYAPNPVSISINELVAHLGSNYVKRVTKDGQVYYSDRFYDEYGSLLMDGLSYKEAIVSMGLDPEILGDDRITSVGRRAVKKAKNREPLDDFHPGDYDGSEELYDAFEMYNKGEIDKDEMMNRMLARLIYSRGEIDALKKNRGMKPDKGFL